MITTTQEYKDSVYAVSRKAETKVVFQVIDVDALGDASTSVTSEASISRKSQVTNSNINMAGKLATFENDYWKLDGTYVLPPKSTEAIRYIR